MHSLYSIDEGLQVNVFCMTHLLFSLYFFQAVPQRRIFAKRDCVSMEVSARTSGTPTPATVRMAVEARTVNKVCVCVCFINQCYFIYFHPYPCF